MITIKVQYIHAYKSLPFLQYVPVQPQMQKAVIFEKHYFAHYFSLRKIKSRFNWFELFTILKYFILIS